MHAAKSGNSGNWKMPLGRPPGVCTVPLRRPIRGDPRRSGGQPTPARTAQWCARRDQRRATLAARHQDDAAWRQARLELRQRWSALPVISAWIAILVIVDNCTRQCLGLPRFVAGPQVTAEMIVEALGLRLPPELQFLMSDRGTHFTANAFKTLVLSEAFSHVLIARHRPQSNGIAAALCAHPQRVVGRPSVARRSSAGHASTAIPDRVRRSPPSGIGPARPVT